MILSTRTGKGWGCSWRLGELTAASGPFEGTKETSPSHSAQLCSSAQMQRLPKLLRYRRDDTIYDMQLNWYPNLLFLASHRRGFAQRCVRDQPGLEAMWSDSSFTSQPGPPGLGGSSANGDFLGGAAVSVDWLTNGGGLVGGAQPLHMGTDGCTAGGASGVSPLVGMDGNANSTQANTIQDLVKLTECSWQLCSQALQACGDDAQRCRARL